MPGERKSAKAFHNVQSDGRFFQTGRDAVNGEARSGLIAEQVVGAILGDHVPPKRRFGE